MAAPQNMAKAQGPPGFQQPQQDRMASMENKLDKFFDAISTKITSQDENQERMEAKFDQKLQRIIPPRSTTLKFNWDSSLMP